MMPRRRLLVLIGLLAALSACRKDRVRPTEMPAEAVTAAPLSIPQTEDVHPPVTAQRFHLASLKKTMRTIERMALEVRKLLNYGSDVNYPAKVLAKHFGDVAQIRAPALLISSAKASQSLAEELSASRDPRAVFPKLITQCTFCHTTYAPRANRYVDRLRGN